MAPASRNGLALKLGYSSGTLAFSVKDVAFGAFVLFYYTSVVVLKGSLAGLVLLIAMVWDAVTDPIVGSISDNLRTRWGRRHPLMAIGGVRTLIGWLSAIVLTAIAWGVIFKGDGVTDGRLIEDNYDSYGVVSFVLVALFTTIWCSRWCSSRATSVQGL